MKTTGDNLDKALESGLKAIASEEVAVPRNFRAQVMARIQAPASAKLSWQDRFVSYFTRPALAFGMAAAAAAFVWFQQKAEPVLATQEIILSKAASSTSQTVPLHEAKPELYKDKSSVASIEGRAEASALQKSTVKQEPVLTAKIQKQAEEKFASMPARLPNSLNSLNSLESSAGSSAARAAAPEEIAEAASTQPIRILVTPEPTPMLRALEGFSQARRNVFKPDQGEYVALMFFLEIADHVTVQIFDLNGRLVSHLIEENRHSGLHEVHWNGYDTQGRMSASGKYIALIKARDSRQISRHKIALIR